MRDVIGPDAGLAKAVFDGALGKRGVILFTAEALFLGGGDETPVNEQRRGAVVVKRGNAEDSGQVRPRDNMLPSSPVP